MRDGLADILPAALLYPQESGDAPVFRLAGAFARVLKTQQGRERFFGLRAIKHARADP